MADSFGGFPVSEFLAEKIAPYIGTGPHRGPNTAPPTPAYNGALARALLGNVTQPRMAPAPAAPSIRPGRALMPSLPTEGVGRGLASQSPTPLSAVSSQGNTGAAGLAAGIGKLGTRDRRCDRRYCGEACAATDLCRCHERCGVDQPIISHTAGAATVWHAGGRRAVPFTDWCRKPNNAYFRPAGNRYGANGKYYRCGRFIANNGGRRRNANGWRTDVHRAVSYRN